MSPENSGQHLNYAAARVLLGPKVELGWVVEGNWPRQACAQGGRWPACIMDGAKYASAAGAEWRRWRTTAQCQPIGCPRVMHITLPPAPRTPLPAAASLPPKKVCFSSHITSPAFYPPAPATIPKTPTWRGPPQFSPTKVGPVTLQQAEPLLAPDGRCF